MKYLRYLSIIILTVIAGCDKFDEFVVTEKPYVDQTSVQLYIGEHAGDRSSVKLTSSPDDAAYVWTSLDPSIATVDQTGLVTAVAEGFTSIILASKDDQTTIDVNVKEFIPLTGFTVSANVVIGSWEALNRVYLTPIPENATETNIEWTSSDENVAMVYSNGMIKTLGVGRAVVTAKGGGHEEKIEVFVPSKMSKDGWNIPGYNPDSDLGTIGYSSQATNEGAANKVVAIIDNDLNTYWHARYGGSGATDYPHWFIVDMGKDITLAQISMAKRNNNEKGQKGFQLFTCSESGATDLDDPTTWTWEEQGDFSFNPKKNGDQMYPIMNVPTARYIKVYMGEKHKGTDKYAMVADLSAYVVE